MNPTNARPFSLFVVTLLMVAVVFGLPLTGSTKESCCPPVADKAAIQEPTTNFNPTSKSGKALTQESSPQTENLETVQCEHKIPQIDCDECRYELGVVKVPASAASFITVEKLTASPMPVTIEAVGELQYQENRLRAVSTRFPGRLASMSLNVGDPVQEGSPVAIIESLELAQAALDFIRRKTEEQVQLQRKQREEALFVKKIAAQQEVQEAELAWKTAMLETSIARRKLQLFGLSEDAIRHLDLQSNDPAFRGLLPLKAPMTGRIINRACTVGEMFGLDHQLFTIADVSHLLGVAQIYEKDMESVIQAFKAKPIRAELTNDAFPKRRFSGQVISLESMVATQSRTLPIRIEVENHQDFLRAGMFFHVRLFLDEGPDAATLPVSSVLEDGGRTFVFVRIKPDLFQTRDVVIGRRLGDRLIIQSGVQQGDDVVVEGGFLLKSDVLREKMGAGCAD